MLRAVRTVGSATWRHQTRAAARLPALAHARHAGLQPAARAPPCWQGAQPRRLAVLRCAADAAVEVAAPETTPAAEASPVTGLDIRVGRIVSCEQHPDADSLYVEQIEVGEPEPRTIVSGLVKYVPLEQMQDRRVLVLCNLKPRNMRGVKSNGMLLCASDAPHENVEPLSPPEEAPVGERVWFGEGNQGQPEADSPNKVQKKKIWEAVQPDLKTDGARVANYKGAPMLTSGGPVTAATLADGNIS